MKQVSIAANAQGAKFDVIGFFWDDCGTDHLQWAVKLRSRDSGRLSFHPLNEFDQFFKPAGVAGKLPKVHPEVLRLQKLFDKVRWELPVLSTDCEYLGCGSQAHDEACDWVEVREAVKTASRAAIAESQ